MNRFRIPSTSRVRRRLFSDPDAEERARIDNCTNVLQEQVSRENIEQSKKWNFDFANEKPLEGIYEWTACGEDWIGKQKNETTVKGELEANAEAFEEELGDARQKLKLNTKTPRTIKEVENVPIVRKRKKESTECRAQNGVKRSLSFD
ncbi:hypothetical protein EVAR_49694_1 [Eumeta japonica]|uniref:Cyclin-dependent kinase inhibitor domain-containing protein n=1 Tax=Eumeta variegata TaxID=151549 RepID=A0A4C1Z705_EUMVA|nr:hypothetical protein EVAR_49694_1 [Eumeta japonica]